MIVGKPYRLVPCASLVILLAAANFFTADPGFPGTQARAQRTFQFELRSPQAAVFSRTALRALRRRSQPQSQRLFYPAVIPARLSAAGTGGSHRLPRAVLRGFGRHVPSGSGRSPPLFFL